MHGLTERHKNNQSGQQATAGNSNHLLVGVEDGGVDVGVEDQIFDKGVLVNVRGPGRNRRQHLRRRKEGMRVR